MCVYPQTIVFYSFAVLVELGVACFLGHIFFRANQNTSDAVQWRESSEDSRDMWIDAAKTMISAAGIAAALLASVSTRQNNSLSPLVPHSLKFATVTFVICVCVSMALILTLARGHEMAKGRAQLAQKDKTLTGGPLSNLALGLSLGLAFFALSGFFVGFLFLARIVWHL